MQPGAYLRAGMVYLAALKSWYSRPLFGWINTLTNNGMKWDEMKLSHCLLSHFLYSDKKIPTQTVGIFKSCKINLPTLFRNDRSR